MAAAAASNLPSPAQPPPSNLFVFVVGLGAAAMPPPPGRHDVPTGSAGWLRADDPEAAATIATTAWIDWDGAGEAPEVEWIFKAFTTTFATNSVTSVVCGIYYNGCQ